MKAFKHLPNLLTLMNMLSGILSIHFFAEGKLAMAAWMVFVAAVFDFLDGFAARQLKAYSKIGAQLDSLADVVSFGVAPALLVYQLIINSHGRFTVEIGGLDILPFMAFLYPLFTGLRLAKFNVDERQSDSFLGLPSPAAAILLASLPLVKEQLYEGQSLFYMIVTNTYFYIGVVVAVCLLMVSELPLFSLKFKTKGLRGNEIRYFFLLVSLVLLVLLQFVAIPFIILIYVFLSLLGYLADLSW